MTNGSKFESRKQMNRALKGALNPNFLNLTKNREKFCF